MAWTVAISLGTTADAWIASGATRRVSHVFDHALHLSGDDGILALGDPSLGRGPCTVLVSHADWPGIRKAAAPGDLWQSASCLLTGPNQRIAAPASAVWHQPPWPKRAADSQIAAALEMLEPLLARSEAPIVRAALAGDTAGDPIARAAAQPLRELAAWLETPRDPPPLALIGLGPGLTPSGDDVLAGVMLTLDAFGERDRRNRLADAVRAVAPTMTSALSATLLGEAGEGRAAEPHVAAVSMLVSGDLDALVTAIDAVADHGATSGWDFLAGAWLAGAAVTAAESSGCSSQRSRTRPRTAGRSP